MSLNKSQSTAVEHGKGPCLTLAGPGSGKTLVITNRIYNLITKQNVNPSNILVITFTKAAANEMHERFLKMCNNKAYPVTFGTFHAVFFKILKYAYNYSASNIIREEERQRFFKQIVSAYPIEIDDETEFIQGITSEISKIKNEQIDINNYYSTNCPEQIFREIYNSYEQFLFKRRLIDFDDMLVYCYELFTAREDILKIWQNKYKYILIDEFQDINTLQYKIIKLLAMPENNLFIVGDDDQSIYRFRGANPSIMLNFEKDFTSSKRILLDTNYRCSGRILAGAKKVISHNRERFDKEIKAFREEGEPVVVRQFENLQKEVDSIVDELQNYKVRGIEYSDMAILLRTNTQPGLLVQKLMEFNIPFCMKDVMPNIYEHWIVKNIKTYIKIANGSNLRSDYLQIINRPNRYVSREAFDSENVEIDKLMEFYSDKEWMQERIDRLQFDLARIQNMNPFAAIQYIRKSVEYDSYLKEYAEYRRINEEELFDLLNEVQENSKQFKTCDEWFEYMEDYSKQLKEQAGIQQNNSEGVILSTMHASKGLEYKVVYIPDANESITPHHKSVLEPDLEEERRLFYVAMTRAKDHLHIYYTKERYNKELNVSRFVEELLSTKP